MKERERERRKGFKVRNKQNYDASRVNDFLKILFLIMFYLTLKKRPWDDQFFFSHEESDIKS